MKKVFEVVVSAAVPAWTIYISQYGMIDTMLSALFLWGLSYIMVLLTEELAEDLAIELARALKHQRRKKARRKRI